MKGKRRVFKQISGSKNLGIGQDRDAVGFGYVIIPNDIDRDTYIKSVYFTGYCMIVTQFNEVIRNVVVPDHVIQEIDFPAIPDEYGSLISWTNQPKTNQVVIVGKLRPPGGSELYQEHTYRSIRSLNDGKAHIQMSDIRNLNTRSWVLSLMNDKETIGQMVFKASSGDKSSSLALKANGDVDLNSDNDANVQIENQIQVNIGSTPDKISTLTLNQDGSMVYEDYNQNKIEVIEGKVIVTSPTITMISQDDETTGTDTQDKDKKVLNFGAIDLGDSPTEAGVLGNILLTELNKNNALLNALVAAIKSSIPFPGDGGSAIKTAIVSAVSALPAADYSSILSGVVKLK